MNQRVEQLRAQGEQTRTRLLEVARVMLAESSESSLNAIAKAAGVGIGTLYRHFPTREDLVFSLYRGEVERLAIAAEHLIAVEEPPGALLAWLHRYADFVLSKAGLVQALRGTASHGRFTDEAYGPVAAAINTLLAANVAAGTVSTDYTADDVLLAVDGLYLLDPDVNWTERIDRLFAVVVRGLAP